MISEFPHRPPTKEYAYEYEEFNTQIIRIWLCCSRRFDYNLGKPTKSIWGFYNSKKKEYLAPINSTKPGKQVNISHTTPYSAMQIHQTPLEKCFQ